MPKMYFQRFANFDFGRWTKLAYLLFLGLATIFCYNAWWFFIQYIGDVAAYTSAHKVNKFHEIRGQIQEIGLSVANAVYGAKDKSGRFEYEQLIIVGHSLGSVLAYDTLNAVINRDLLLKNKNDVVKRTRLLLTFGCPLDKTAYFFRS